MLPPGAYCSVTQTPIDFLLCYNFYYTPVFRRDVLWYGDVRPSVRPSVRPGLRPSIRPSVRPSVRHSFPHFSPTCFEILSWNFVYHFILMHVRASSNAMNFRQFLLELCPFLTSNMQFSALFSYMLWDIDLKFCIWLCFTVLQIKFECRQFASIFVGVMPLLELKLLEIHSFPHFSITCFDILSWNFAYDFVLRYYRSRSSVVNLRQFLWELCPFWNLNYWKYTVFRTFLLHALTYWAEILHMTLFYCTTDQVRVSSICVNFCGSYAPFGT